MAELDSLSWGNSWTVCTGAQQLLTFSPGTGKYQKLVCRLADLAETNIPVLERSGFPHQNSRMECACGGGKRPSKDKQGTDERINTEKEVH